METRNSWDTTSVIEEFKITHGCIYDYSLVQYKTMHTKVIIICDKHGQFDQTPHAHIKQMQGCPKCGIESNTNRQRNTTQNFVNKCIEIHGARYDYSKVTYGKTAHDKVIVVCKEHGDFLVSPNQHLSKKTNCPQCARRSSGWTKTSWRYSCQGKIPKLYIIKCVDNEEEFFKIGITNKASVDDRFRSTLLPYNYEIVKVIESTDSDYIYNLERTLHKLHNKVKYIPKIWFDGATECFSKILIELN